MKEELINRASIDFSLIIHSSSTRMPIRGVKISVCQIAHGVVVDELPKLI